MLSSKVAELKEAVLAERAKAAEKKFHAHLHDQATSGDLAGVTEAIKDMRELKSDTTAGWENEVAPFLDNALRRYFELSQQ